MDSKGNLYGTTKYGGTNKVGGVYEITVSGTVPTLYSFVKGQKDGYDPMAGLVMDKGGDCMAQPSGAAAIAMARCSRWFRQSPAYLLFEHLNSPGSKLREYDSRYPTAASPLATTLAVCLALLIFLSCFLARPGFTYLRAAGLLLRMENPQHAGIIGAIHTYPIEESLTHRHARRADPRAALHSQGHCQRAGDGDRSWRASSRHRRAAAGRASRGPCRRAASAFSRRSCSRSPITMLKAVPSLSSDTRRAAFPNRLRQKVGVLGISFGGGLSLLAASDPRFDRYIRFVVSVGAHDDLERVSQFLITNQIARPDGTTLHMAAHEYGALILIYSHVDDFFPPADVSTAHEALQWLLWEKVDESRKACRAPQPAFSRENGIALQPPSGIARRRDEPVHRPPPCRTWRPFLRTGICSRCRFRCCSCTGPRIT